jgi:predicted transcriptional regulator
MSLVQLPTELQQVIDRQVSMGRAASEASFLAEAVACYAAVLDADEQATVAAAEAGIADIEAGRFRPIDSPEDMARWQAEVSERVGLGAVRP